MKIFSLGMALFGFLMCSTPALAVGEWSSPAPSGWVPQVHFLNDLLHHGGNHPATHSVQSQVRTTDSTGSQRQVPIKIEWLHEDIPDCLSEDVGEPFETYELD